MAQVFSEDRRAQDTGPYHNTPCCRRSVLVLCAPACAPPPRQRQLHRRSSTACRWATMRQRARMLAR